MTRRKKTPSRVNPPRIPAQPEPLRLVPADIGEGDRFVDALIEDCSLNDLGAYQLELKRVRLPEELRGVMVSPAQMVTLSWMLARRLGVVVGDEEE